MSRITSVFAEGGRKALIAYITCGFPNPKASLEIVPCLAESGCDIIELGIPFSDPLADGATIQRASEESLRQGVNPKLCLELAQNLRHVTQVPLVFMTYYNPILNFGLEAFCSKCVAVGIDGLIIPDLPPEEGEELESSTRGQGLDLIYLLAPVSTEERIALVAERSQGFIYLVSLTGVTGARERLPSGLEEFVSSVKKKTSKPLCIGFGVSNPEQAKGVAQVADGVIIGSKIIKLIEEDKTLRKLEIFVKEVRKEMDLGSFKE